MRRKKIGATFVAIAFAATMVFCVSCAQPVEEETKDPYVEELYLPEIIEREDGTLVQRTPDEGEVKSALDTSYPYHNPEQMASYNTFFLDADNRGCNSCHDDLAETLFDMEGYLHVDLRNTYGIQLTVQMCKDCHTFGYGYQTNQNAFGTLMHGIHNTTEKSECWSCHVATGSGAGMELWDEAKHNQLRGITAVQNVEGDFSFNQDKLVAAEDIFDFNWHYFDLDYLRYENTINNVELDQETFDTWTVTVSGAVDKETTYTLPELTQKFESVTLPLTFHCTLNPMGGPLLANSMYTGVKLSDVFADAGIDPDWGAFTSYAPDGFVESVQAQNFDEAYICYEIDGKPLPWKQGYPVQLVVPHSGAPASVKQLSDIVVNTKAEAAEIHEWNGWPNEVGPIVDAEGGISYYTTKGWPYIDDNGYKNKPNVGLFDFEEGQVIKTGEPYEFTGYASSWDEAVVAIEFSMDDGRTWTQYDTSSASKDNWILWSFTFTPETDSAYVLAIRGVSDTGRVSEEPIEVLFNAKSA